MNMADGQIRKIVVGLRLDPFFKTQNAQNYSHAAEAEQVMKTAQAMAVKAQASLHLLAVLEDGELDVMAAVPWLPAYNWRDLRMDRLLEETRKLASANVEKQLAALQSQFQGPCAISSQLVHAEFAASGLMKEATAQNASMIILGAGVKADQYFTRGYSTPLAVMSESLIPVLVIGRNCERDFSRSRLKILLADDLREQSAHAMSAAVDWAASLEGAADVHQVHIEELSEKEMRRILGQTIPELRTNADHDKLAEDMVKVLETAFAARLKDRVQGADARLQKAGGTFQFEVRRCGNVRDELERAADEFDADIVIFSRHQKIHRRPFLVGRVTYQAMLSQKRAVMVIP